MKTKPPVEKNKVYTIKIQDMGSEGQGVGKVDGFTVFIPDALLNETCEVLIVKVNKNVAFAKVLKIIEVSKDRVEPACPVAKRCGGCSLQHMSYDAQLSFKTKRVQDVLERIGGFENPVVLPAIGMETPYHFRNKSQVPVGQDKNGPIIGFYAKRSHNIVDCTHCKIQPAVNDKIIAQFRSFIEEFEIPVYNEDTNKGLLRHIVIRNGFASGEIMVTVVANGAKIPRQEVLIERLREIEGMTSIVLNTNRLRTNVILGDKTRTLWGQDYIQDSIDDISFHISPLSFFQVNPVQTRILYSKALELADIGAQDRVLDIYCGIGTISLFMAKKAKEVLGVEIIPEAVEDARKNAELNGITNAKFRVGSAEDLIPIIKEEGYQPNIVVVDPPRKGCEEKVLQTIVDMSPEKVVYVSCEPSTLARDLKYLCSNGYRLGPVQPVDQFCHSTKVEAVTLLEKING